MAVSMATFAVMKSSADMGLSIAEKPTQKVYVIHQMTKLKEL